MLPNGFETELPNTATPARDTTNRILNSLNCDASTRAATIKDDGTARGVISVQAPKAVDQIQQAAGDGIDVETDHAD